MKKTRMPRDMVVGLVVLAGLAASAGAQDFASVDTGSFGEMESAARPSVPPVELDRKPAAAEGEEEEPGSRFSVSFGADITSQYFFRGIVQEDSGFIVQPWADLGVALVRKDDYELTLIAGTWASVHGDTDTAGDEATLPNFYELDVYGGLGVSMGSWGVQALYIAYMSPSDAFDTVEEIAVSLSYDDSEKPLLGGIALSPYATVAFEIGDDAADGGETGVYLEIGIAPSYTYGEDSAIPGLTVSLPVTIGLSLDDYYESAGDDDFFGYVDVGLELSLPIVEDSGFGTVELHGGVHLLVLGDNLETINDGDDMEVIATFGVSVSF